MSNPCGLLDKPCCLCKHSGKCVASMNDDDFELATVKEVERRLNNPCYMNDNLIKPEEKELMTKYVKGEI